jgi:hypothetical protein
MIKQKQIKHFSHVAQILEKCLDTPSYTKFSTNLRTPITKRTQMCNFNQYRVLSPAIPINCSAIEAELESSWVEQP